MNTDLENDNKHVLCVFVNFLGADVTYWIYFLLTSTQHYYFFFKQIFMFTFKKTQTYNQPLNFFLESLFCKFAQFQHSSTNRWNDFEQKICVLIIKKSRLRF